ncbi:hypothetical protein CU035_1198 [Enterococcus faecium]|nr:hypothetical protein [Enterococcus faecium]MBK4793005.1 hypothetical protein [Enterococcus faecium]
MYGLLSRANHSLLERKQVYRFSYSQRRQKKTRLIFLC